MPAQTLKVLVIEDEFDIRELIALHLRREGYQVEAVAEGEEGLKLFQKSQFDLVLVDWMLPGLNGLALVRELRKSPDAATTPILMVTAKVEPSDIVAGLEGGADDYVTKPFEIPVLLARVRALLRRTSAQPLHDSAETLKLGGLEIRPDSYQVNCHGKPIGLTLSEYKLLVALVQNSGRVLTRERLIDLVQGEGVSVVDRAVDTHVFGLRKKLGDCSELIETVRGVGYRVRLE